MENHSRSPYNERQNKMKKVSMIETLDELVTKANNGYKEGKTSLNLNKRTVNYVAYFDGGEAPYKTDFVHVVSCARCGTPTISQTENTDNNENMDICSNCTSAVLKGIHKKALDFWKNKVKKAKSAKKYWRDELEIQVNYWRNRAIEAEKELGKDGSEFTGVSPVAVSLNETVSWGEPIDLDQVELELDSPIIGWSKDPASLSPNILAKTITELHKWGKDGYCE
jgi:hypothetical protein